VAGRGFAASAARRDQRAGVCRSRPARLPRIPAAPRHHGRAGPGLPQNLLRVTARRLHARPAQLPRPRRTAHRQHPDARRLSARTPAARLAEARIGVLARDLEGDRRRYAARLCGQPDRDRACRRSARPRAGDCRAARFHQARRHAQYAVAHRRPALHGRALLRPEPRRVPGFCAVLGVRLRPAPCRHLDAGADGAHFRSAGDVSESRQRRTGRQPRTLLRLAIFRSCGDRRRRSPSR
jgi:hypothetical protein